MSGNFHETNVFDDITENGTYPAPGDPPFQLSGEVILGFYGNFGAATVKFIFETERPDNTLEALPEHSDWVFSTKPGPERFKFSKTLPFRMVVSGADGSTDFGLNIHNL
ncbi:hypothetical protein [Marinobacter sp. DS40M6]|uniref:hypothetical protein n=1 Tax=Marinobacter sp. DS40M6 TaxID=1597776 RepID=UPI002358E964|nr:hypothetical protein [Marinobacter sp. DS40M6]MDC8457805.1 hypothetical protein [Marinobacter sp. DS40M6]